MRGGWRIIALLAGLTLFAVACTQTPSGQSTASPTDTSAATPTPTPTPTPTATPSSTPTASPPSQPSAKLTIRNFSLHLGEAGVGYLPVPVGGEGGTPPYSWSIRGGALPGGLVMSPSGVVSGTPRAAGTYSFTILLEDAGGSAAGVGRSITIVPHVTATGLCTSSCSVEQGCVTVCGAYADVSGGVGPYFFARTQGALPPGTSLSGQSLAGTFTKTSANVPFSFVVRVTDAFGATSTVRAVFVVFAHIAFSVTNVVCGNSPNNCTLQIRYTGGVPGGTPAVVAIAVIKATIFLPATNNCFSSGGFSRATSSPPPGMATSANGGVMTLSAGPPDGTTWCGYGGTIIFALFDPSPCGPTSLCSTTRNLSVLFGL
jgi:large repetitive protein